MNYETVITLEENTIANIYINTPEDSEFFGRGLDYVVVEQFDYIDIDGEGCREWIEYILDTLNKKHWDDCRVYSIMDACPELVSGNAVVYH